MSDQQADFIQFFVASTQGIPANECCDGAELETCIGDLGVTSFNSCPNPWLETASPLHWHWIRLDLTRSHSQPSARPVFPMLRSNYQFYMAPQFIPYRCQSIHPPPHCNKPILHEERDKKKAYLTTGSRRTFLCSLLNVTSDTLAEIRLQAKCREAALCDFSMGSIVLFHHLAFTHECCSSAEMPETSGPLTALLNTHCLSEVTLSQRVSKLPFRESKACPNTSPCPS